MATIEVAGTRLGYDEAGSGPAVLLCHAGIADRRMWAGPFEALAGRCRVVRFDWRGYGDSDPARTEHTLDGDVLALLDALDIDRAVLAGCSVGGAAALDAALAAPDRVTGLVLVASGLSGHTWPEGMVAPLEERVAAAIPAERRQAYRDGTAAEVREEDLAAIADAYGHFMIAGPGREPADVDPAVWEAAMSMLRDVFRRDWVEHPEQPTPAPAPRLGDVTVPTVVVNGLADVPGLQEVADLLTDGIPGARRVDLPETGHLPPLERPAEVTAAITQLL